MLKVCMMIGGGLIMAVERVEVT